MKLLTERSEEKFWSSFNFFNSFFYIYKSAGCRQSIFFTHIANKLFFSHTFGSKLFLGVNLANKLFFYEKTIPPPPGIKWSAPNTHPCIEKGTHRTQVASRQRYGTYLGVFGYSRYPRYQGIKFRVIPCPGYHS